MALKKKSSRYLSANLMQTKLIYSPSPNALSPLGFCRTESSRVRSKVFQKDLRTNKFTKNLKNIKGGLISLKCTFLFYFIIFFKKCIINLPKTRSWIKMSVFHMSLKRAVLNFVDMQYFFKYWASDSLILKMTPARWNKMCNLLPT